MRGGFGRPASDSREDGVGHGGLALRNRLDQGEPRPSKGAKAIEIGSDVHECLVVWWPGLDRIPAIRNNEVRRLQANRSGEFNRQRIADAAVGQSNRDAAKRQRPRRQDAWHGGTGLDDVGEPRPSRIDGRKIPRLMAGQVVTHHAELLDPVVQAAEVAGLELCQSMRNHPAEPAQPRLDRRMGSQRQAVHDNVMPSERRRIRDHLVDGEADGGVVGGDNRAGADADDHVDRNVMAQNLPEHPEMRRASQPSGAQDDADARVVVWSIHVVDMVLRDNRQISARVS
jgi:hypothetical protein